MSIKPITYRIAAAEPAAHRFHVSCTVPAPDPEGQRFALPAWIPGSYLIRDFARHVVAIRAEADGRPVGLEKTDKQTWRAAPLRPGRTLTVHCEIQAGDLSVRGAYLDPTRAFFNGSSVFLRVLGQEDRPCRVMIEAPAGAAFADWQLATAMEPARGEPGAARRNGFGLYRAADYDELIDHPVALGHFARASFKACGVPHEIAISGRHDADLARLTDDLARVCTWQIQLFGEPAPMRRYLFLVDAVGDGYGGLEHRASTALVCSRHDLPYPRMVAMPEGYRKFLGLCSHEYFHTWNVKRIKPAAFVPYDLERENLTTLLWAFEGITSYYDDLALLRSGVIGLADWLELAAQTISNVARTPGRQRQSLAESSRDAWIKFYKPDEHSLNTGVSYYAKGALAALALDLTLRNRTHGRHSLDDVMRALWQRHGLTGIGVAEEGIRRVAEEVSGIALGRFFAEAIDGTGELPLARLLKPFGIDLEWETAKTPALGVRTTNEAGEIKLAAVYDGGAAQAAGLAPGDILLAIDGLRVTPAGLDAVLTRRRPGEILHVHAFRRDELMAFDLRLDPPPAETARLRAAARPNALRRAWLEA